MIKGKEGFILTLTFAYETYYIFLFHLFSVFILVFMNFVIWMKAKKVPLLHLYLAVQGIIALWIISKLFKNIAPNAGLKFFFVVCQYAGVCFLGEVFFIFAYLYATKRMLSVKYMVVLAIPSLFFLLVIITNPYHFLFYAHFDFWGDSFGPVFYFHQGYNYILLLAGLILCAKNFNRQFGEKHIQAILFSIGIIIPIVANMLYVFDWFEIVFGFEPPFDITPMSCTLSLMLFAVAIFRYRFFDDVKIARRTAVDLIPEGILLVDGNSRIIDFNTTFKSMLENGELFAADGQGIITGPVKHPLALYDKADFIRGVIKSWDGVYQTEKGCFYKAVYLPIISNGKIRGYSLWFVDLTFKQNVLYSVESRNTELEKLNKRLEEQARIIRNLAIARTRNFIAAEMHDIIGHSVVLVISLLEVAGFSSDKETFDLNRCICQAEILLKDCLLKIENSILGQPDKMADRYSLVDRLHVLFDDVKPASVSIDLSVSGNTPKLPLQYEDTIFKICREGITNAIRHGKADKVYIILRFLSDHYETYIIDNGTGCDHVKKGMGLTGMETRTKALNGMLLYSSVGGQGFCVQMLLPAI